MFPLIIAAVVVLAVAASGKKTAASSTSTGGTTTTPSGVVVPAGLAGCFQGVTDPEVARALLEVLTDPNATPQQLLQTAASYTTAGLSPAAKCIAAVAKKKSLFSGSGSKQFAVGV